LCFSIEYGMVRHKNGSNVPFVDDIAIYLHISPNIIIKVYQIHSAFNIRKMDSFSMSIFTISWIDVFLFLQGSNTFIRYTGVSPPIILFVFMNNLFSRRFWMLHFMLHTHPFSRKEIDFIIIFFYYIKKWHFCVISSEMKIEL
jgi:hypothetical protein